MNAGLLNLFVVVVVFFFFRLSLVACRILVPQPGIEPGVVAVKARSPDH